ncbi:MAG: PAS domain S-box protein [Syntrophales bacterium]|nr:PAS domain S-box protein [Syntrophales bacterium]
MTDKTPLYNSRLTKNYVEYLKIYHPDVDIASLLKYAGIETYQLDDEGHWLFQEQVDRFHEKLAEKTNNPNIAREVGRFAVTSKSSGALRQYLLGFISPATAYAVIEKINARLVRSALIRIKSIGADKIEAKATLMPNVVEKPYQCLNRLGSLEAVAKIFTGKYAKIEHPICLHKGGDCCLYNISWEKTRVYVWKLIRNCSYILGFIACVLSVSFMPPAYWDILVLSFLLIVIGTTLYTEHREKKELIATIRDQGDAADRLIEQINTSYNNVLLVQEIGQATSMILEINQLLVFIMEALEKRLDFDRGVILLANREKTRLVYTIGYGYNQEHREYLENIEFHLDNPNSRGAFVLSFRNQTPLLINNIDEITKDFSSRSVEFAKKMGTHSFICVPIVFKGESMGVLVVDNTRSKRLLSQSDMSLLMGIAPQIAISINNALAYRKIAESEKKFRSLSESTPDIIYTIDTQGVFTYVNPAWERILGYSSEEAVGRHFIDFARKDEIPLYIRMFKSIRDEGSTIRDQIGTLINKDGTDRFFSISGAPVFDSEGQIAGVVGTFKDVTERKLAEVKLEGERAFLRQVVDAVPSFISVRDAEGRFQLANKSLAKACGTTPDRLIGKTLANFNPNDEVVQKVHADNLDVIHNRKEIIIPDEISTYPDPSVKWLSTHKVPLIDQDDVCGRILTVSTNITHMKNAEEEKNKLQNQLIQIQKMEAVGTLAGGVAHDFNNILMGLQGYLSMLLYDMSPDHPYRTKLENMDNYVRRGSDLTRQLLGFARGGKYDVKPTNINELVGKSVDLFGRTRKEISIYRSFAEDAWTVDVDQGQMDQVFLNLFINASQAMPGGGDLDLQTENVFFSEMDEKPVGVTTGRYVRISVTDNGVGMDSKILERIFEPFFTTKQKGTGTGLGLASAYGIIKNHGGSIHVFSEPGKGTTFHIYLPATDHQPDVSEEKKDEVFTGGETILVVDDEPINIAVMQEMLEMLHYRVLLAGSGQEAVAVYMVKQKEIDIVILDMVMPGISGGRTFDLLREINPDVGVILASGYSAEGEARKIINRGCWGFIQKPFKLQEFSKKIREVLDNHGRKATT